jgi:ribosome-associated protein
MVDVVADKMAEDIVLLDIREQSVIADYFIICSGTSKRQLKAIADGLSRETKTQYQLAAWYVEGEADTGWVLMDYGDVIVHAFAPEVRRYYDLEGLWSESPVLLKMQ